MVGKSVQATMLVPRSNGRGLIFSEVRVVRAFDYPIAGRSFRFAIHPPVAPLEHVAYVISEFKTGRQCGLLERGSNVSKICSTASYSSATCMPR